MFPFKARLLALSLSATLAAACASTVEPEAASGDPVAESGTEAESVGETSSAASACALVCTFQYQSDNRAYLYSCRGCGTTFRRTYPFAKGKTFCYSRLCGPLPSEESE